MALLRHFEAQTSRRAAAGLLSTVLHLGLAALILLAGGPDDGTRDEDSTPAAQWVPLEAESPQPVHGPGRSAWQPPAQYAVAAPSPDLPRIEPATVPPPDVDIPHIETENFARADSAAVDPAEEAVADFTGPMRASAIPREQAVELQQRIEQLAGDLPRGARAQRSWQHDGLQYHADFVVQPARDGFEPERVLAEVSTEDQGRQLRTWISLKRLPFSHYAKLIDRWDPMVQLHDDEIVGRMHVNSRFNVLYDAQAAPRVLGKVTTAAGGFNVERRGRQRDADVFLAGLETRAGRIPFSGGDASFEWTDDHGDARFHELAGDTWIRFHGDGGYSWREGESGAWQYEAGAAGRPVFLIAGPGGVVRVQGVVSGKFLVYSPQRIVVEGSLTYARDPRREPHSDDYLGLVSDRDIVVAPPHVTGPGDLDIYAALFARRRMVVRNADHGRSATLGIFGSLAAGTLSESEPRYAMKIEYDRRFDRHRPPGFPSTNRFAIEDWDRQWTEVPEGPVSAAP